MHGWHDLCFYGASQLFFDGDILDPSETLATMRHCLSAVGEVAEFAKVRKQLEVLEERLDEMVQPRLLDALSNRKVDAVQDLHGIEVEKRGGENTSISFSSWLPSFYDETLLYLEQEWKWCSTAFPEEYRSLVPKVLVEIMSELNSSFVSRVNVATGDAVPETRSVAKGQSSHLHVLRQCVDFHPKRREVHQRGDVSKHWQGEDRGLQFRFDEG